MRAFISYSHQDAEFLASLHQHLAVLRRQKLLETWTDRQIEPGGIVDSEIAAAMEDADLFLLLISSSFINSTYCFDKEFEKALKKQKAGKAKIVPIIVRPCDWNIAELRQFKALPEDGNAIDSRHWHNRDEAFADVVKGLRALLETKKKVEKFTPDHTHVTSEEKKELGRIHEDIVRRLIVKKANQADDVVRAEYGKWAAIVWSQFHEAFGTKKHGLPSLDRLRFAEAKSWLLQYRGSKDKKLKGANPQAYRATLTKTIYSLLKPLDWSKTELYNFATEKLDLSEKVTTLDALGNNQLELLRDRVRYQMTKKKVKAAKTPAKRTANLKEPQSPYSRKLLQAIKEHPKDDERGLTVVLKPSPCGPLYREFAPNTSSSGPWPSVEKKEFDAAVADLSRSGWLVELGGDDDVQIYGASLD